MSDNEQAKAEAEAERQKILADEQKRLRKIADEADAERKNERYK